MFLVLSAMGCFPFVNIETDENEEAARVFGSLGEAEAWAKENCAWDYRIVKW